MAKKTLNEIALEILEKYKKAENSLIWEYSGNIDADEIELDAEVKAYREKIEALSVDVQEVRHGHWIAELRGIYHGINLLYDKNFKGLCMYRCSECEEKVIFKGNYCPNCGAKMDGKE